MGIDLNAGKVESMVQHYSKGAEILFHSEFFFHN